MPLFPDEEFASPFVGEAVMTADGTIVFNSVWYGMNDSAEIIFIGMNSGQARYTGPGKAEATNNLVFYYPSSDQDGDGLPDAGATPALAYPPLTSIDTRLPLEH
jgi:hypothetical protein